MAASPFCRQDVTPGTGLNTHGPVDKLSPGGERGFHPAADAPVRPRFREFESRGYDRHFRPDRRTVEALRHLRWGKHMGVGVKNVSAKTRTGGGWRAGEVGA